MGGIRNYEEVFFTPEYEKHHSDEGVLIQRLKDLIADQIPLLELCVRIHKERASGPLQPLQNRLEDCFAELQDSVEKKYGKRVRCYIIQFLSLSTFCLKKSNCDLFIVYVQ